MFDEFAIMPGVFSIKNELHLERLEDILLSINRNGQLANLEKDNWIKEVINEQLSKLGPSRKKELQELLLRLKNNHRLVRHPKRPNINGTLYNKWLELTYVSHVEKNFFAVLTQDGKEFVPKENEKPLVTHTSEYKKNGDFRNWNANSSQEKISLKEEDFKRVLEPVLRNAKEISIIDYYISPKPAFLPIIKIAAEILGQRFPNKQKGVIRILFSSYHYENKLGLTKDTVKSAWYNTLKSIGVLDKHCFDFYGLEWEKGEQSVHDRYILTDQCGVKCGRGWDVVKGGDSQIILLNDKIWAGIHADYLQENTQCFRRKYVFSL